MLQRIFSKNKCIEKNNLHRLDRHKIRKIKKLLHLTVKRNGNLLVTDGISIDGNNVFAHYIFYESSTEEQPPASCKENIQSFLKEITGITETFNTEESEVQNVEIYQDFSEAKWTANIMIKYPAFFEVQSGK